MNLLTTPATLDTAALPGTTLERLEADAGLLTRVDRKYLVPMHALQGLVDGLSHRAQVLTIADRRRFSYASTYFDTPDLDAYLLAARKRRRRFKVRTRSYLDSNLCFLEVKTRGARGTTIKTRLRYNPDDADQLTSAGRDYVAAQLACAQIADTATARYIAQALTPVLATTYERTTLHLPQDGARATIDTALTWRGLRPESGETAHLRGYGVVETKNPAIASRADRLLWSAGHRPTRISKYATGMALLHPDLPANKWHRTLGRELAGATDSPTAAKTFSAA